MHGTEPACSQEPRILVATQLAKATEEETAVDQQLYQSKVGSLMYLATCTRPDTAYARRRVSQILK